MMQVLKVVVVIICIFNKVRLVLKHSLMMKKKSSIFSSVLFPNFIRTIEKEEHEDSVPFQPDVSSLSLETKAVKPKFSYPIHSWWLSEHIENEQYFQ